MSIPPIFIAALAALLLITVPGRKRFHRYFALTLLLAGMAGGATACGSGSTKSNCDAITAPTTAGIYTITVTGTSVATTSSGTVTLTVN